jgi:hypothetical protein
VSKLNPSFSSASKPYLSALGQLGRTQEAAVGCRRLLAIEPDIAPERFIATSPHKRGSDRDHFAEDQRLAASPGDSSEAAAQSQEQEAD